MKRFSISFNEQEYKQLEKMIEWYRDNLGLNLSRCAVIKQLLFAEFKEIRTDPVI